MQFKYFIVMVLYVLWLKMFGSIVIMILKI